MFFGTTMKLLHWIRSPKICCFSLSSTAVGDTLDTMNTRLPKKKNTPLTRNGERVNAILLSNRQFIKIDKGEKFISQGTS